MQGCDHCKAFLPLEGALDHLLFGFEALSQGAFVLLPFFSLDVDGQNHGVYRKTHDDDRPPPVGGV